MPGKRFEDGRRNMPKLKCPYCDYRLADVADVKLKNQSELKPLTSAENADYVLECPKCKKILALSIKTLHERRSVPADVNSVAMSTGA